MVKPEIITETAITMAEAKNALNRIKERDEEYGFRSGKTHEYLISVPVESEKKAKELIKKIEELNIPRLKQDQIVKIVDVKPKSLEELKVVLQGVTITNDNLKKIEAVIVKDAD
ncbi:hypothetical protein KY308_00885 [Candidatus Woesearchaeota archaeon]|nr:hypothetical protein [Candidatus Woesearchaeota archaeon]